MDILCAPWRMQYIATADAKNAETCIFCDYPRMDNDKKNLLLFRGKTCYLLMNRYPYNSGHLLVIPYRHIADLALLTPEENQELLGLAQQAILALKACMNPDGYNLGVNMGRVAGAGIEKHLHMHIVPRWSGDTNFITVMGDTRVLPEAPEKTYEKILTAWPK